jgi:hypothetical protein
LFSPSFKMWNLVEIRQQLCDVTFRVGASPVMWMNSLLQCLRVASTD